MSRIPRVAWAVGVCAAAGLTVAGGMRSLGVELASSGTAPLPPARREGLLVFDVRDAGSGAPVPSRLKLVGVQGTPDPLPGHAQAPPAPARREGSAVYAQGRVFTASGTGSIHVPAGTYDVIVSHGPEWDAPILHDVTIPPGGTQRVEARLARVIDTTGWLSADLHVHAMPSFDSDVRLEDRVIQFVADGVGMIVSTDHDVRTDYAPVIRELGLTEVIASAVGDELTTQAWGHFGTFPLDAHRSLPVSATVGSAAALFAAVRAVDSHAIIDVHHPRWARLGYFDMGAFDAASGQAGRSGFSLDFDAVEILNGFEGATRASLDRVLADWFALIAHGRVVTATGNSDTHRLDFHIGGCPRNYVEAPWAHTASITPDDLAKALREHRSLLTTGPFIRVSAGGAGIGDLATARSGRLNVEVEVQAAPWISVDRVVVYVGGRIAKTWNVAAHDVEPVRFRGHAVLAFDRDSTVVVRADGQRAMAPVVGDASGFPVTPVAVTNPILVDADGDGRWSPTAAAAPASLGRGLGARDGARGR